jgi:predicted transcriptional regulator
MATRNTTFKLSDDELALLGQIADRMRCSRTDVIRTALTQLDRMQRERSAAANAMIKGIFASVPEGSTLMIGLDDNMQPYATIDGRERRDDLKLVGRGISNRGEDYIQVTLVDPDSDMKLEVGVIQVRTGGWLAILEPFPIQIDYAA